MAARFRRTGDDPPRNNTANVRNEPSGNGGTTNRHKEQKETGTWHNSQQAPGIGSRPTAKMETRVRRCVVRKTMSNIGVGIHKPGSRRRCRREVRRRHRTTFDRITQADAPQWTAMGSFYGMGGAISAKYAETGQQRKVDKRDMRPHDVEVEQTREAGHRSIWGIT